MTLTLFNELQTLSGLYLSTSKQLLKQLPKPQRQANKGGSPEVDRIGLSS
jgi:hypothetical protein